MRGMLLKILCTSFLARRYFSLTRIKDKYSDKAPTFGAIDISLSFKITIILRLEIPALLSPSKASPPVIAPSPITAITL